MIGETPGVDLRKLVVGERRRTAFQWVPPIFAKDFERSSVKAIAPQQLFDELDARGIVYREIPWVE